MIGLVSLKTSGMEGVLLYLAGYLFSTAAAFLVVVWMSAKLGVEKISDYAGLSKRSPIMAAAMLLSMSSLAGVPPMAGFFGKFYILSCAVENHMIWLAALGLLNVITSLYFYLGVLKFVYARPAADPTPLTISLSQRIALYASMAGIVLLGAYPTPALQFATEAVKHLIR
jgi:NADH-quinone oxidoreductase subunit N